MTELGDLHAGGPNGPSATTTDIWVAIFAALGVIVLEVLLVLLAQWGRLSLFPTVLAHLAIVCAILAVGWFGKQPRDRETYFTLAAWTAIAGPFGAAFMPFIVFGAHHGQSRPAPDYAALFSEEEEDPQQNRVQSLVDTIKDNRLNLDAPVGLQSFRACMETGDQAQKLNVLRAIGADYGPDVAPILQMAIVSEDAVIRVMASTVLAEVKKTESEFLLEYAGSGNDAEATNVRRLPSPGGANAAALNNTPVARINPYTRARPRNAGSLAPAPEKAAEKP